MKYPIEPTAFAGFSLPNFDLWFRTHTPSQIELSDQQYMWLAHLLKYNPKDYQGVPIVFVDVPTI